MTITLTNKHEAVTLRDLAGAARQRRPVHAMCCAASVITVPANLALQQTDHWSALATASESAPFLRPEWIAAYLQHYEPAARVIRLDVVRQQHLIGTLPLINELCLWYGVPVRRLRTPVHPLWPDRFDITCAENQAESVARAFWRHLSNQSAWDVIELADLPEGGPGWQLMRMAESHGYSIGIRPSQHPPFMSLGADGHRGNGAPPTSKFRANLRRRRRNLDQLGPLTFRRQTEFDEAMLSQFLQLEHRGWKGQNGTSILSDRRTTDYYMALAREAADSGYLVMYSLDLAGEPIAMHFGLALHGRYFVPKLAFDEAYRALAPGHLLVEDVIKDCTLRGFTEFDFLGDEMPWKMEWTDQLRPHYRVHIFNRTVAGRLAYLARYRVLPRLNAAHKSLHPGTTQPGSVFNPARETA